MFEELIFAALKMRESAYAPYSNYYVGAAVLTQSGKIYGGCNIENASFSATVCAERTAIFKAISENHRTIKAIAIVGGKKEEKDLSDYAYPCGVCRQVISEFANEDTKIIVAKNIDDYKVFGVDEIIPFAFGKGNL